MCLYPGIDVAKRDIEHTLLSKLIRLTTGVDLSTYLVNLVHGPALYIACKITVLFTHAMETTPLNLNRWPNRVRHTKDILALLRTAYTLEESFENLCFYAGVKPLLMNCLSSFRSARHQVLWLLSGINAHETVE